MPDGFRFGCNKRFDQIEIEIPGDPFRINGNWYRAVVDYCQRCGDVCAGADQHLVAGPNSRGGNGKMQCRCSTANSYAMFATTVLCKLLLETHNGFAKRARDLAATQLLQPR